MKLREFREDSQMGVSLLGSAWVSDSCGWDVDRRRGLPAEEPT